MEKIKPGKYVALAYDLYSLEPEGESLAYSGSDDDPERVVFGVDQLFEPLEKALDGLEAGNTFECSATPSQAFGVYDPDRVLDLEKEIFLVDGKFDDDAVKPGEYVPMMTAEGFHVRGKVLEVTADSVKLDFNHPLAGKDVVFRGRVLEVRDATPEEVHMAQGGGCSCGCHDGGDACGCHDGGDACGCHDGDASCGCHGCN